MDYFSSPQPPRKKIWLWVALAITILIAIIFFGYFYRDNIKSMFNKELETTPALDKLIGPISEKRAKELKPEQIIYWTNYYRTQNGLKELTNNKLLANAAQAKVLDMFDKQYFEHVSPTGVKPSDIVTNAGYDYKGTGENLALGDFSNEKDLVDAWMNSPGHRANILSSEYTEIGVATGLNKFLERTKTWIAVQEFGKPMPNCAKPDKNILTSIDSKKAELDQLNSQISNLPAGTTTEQAQTLTSEAQTLANEINSLSTSYNASVDAYNACISR